MVLKNILLGILGFGAGGMIAAGVYAFLAITGVFTRLIGKTETKGRIRLYETVIAAGGICGNFSDLYEISFLSGGAAAQIFLGIFGLSSGIFVGCLFMSLAESFKALPTVSRRIRLAKGLPWLIFALALGKMTGSLIYFFFGFG